MAWNLDTDRPIYTQIIEIIQQRIISGYYPAGHRLPSVRDLAAEAGVNPNTMQRALSDLEQSGLLLTHRTSGRMITEDRALIHSLRHTIASKQIQSCIHMLEHLGYTGEEISDLFTEYMAASHDLPAITEQEA